VLLRRSAAAPEIPGLEDVAPGRMTAGVLLDRWLARLAAGLSAEWVADTLSAEERERAAGLSETRYAAARWTENRER